MSARIGYRPKLKRRRTFIKEWREFRSLTQEQLAERVGTSKASVSRIEAGTQSYTQDLLEAFGEALRTEPASLLMRNPSDESSVWSLWDRAKPAEKQMIEEIAKTIVKTGTN